MTQVAYGYSPCYRFYPRTPPISSRCGLHDPHRLYRRGVSSNLGALLFSAVDRCIGLINRLTAAIADSRDARYIKHTLHDLLTLCVFQIGSGHE